MAKTCPRGLHQYEDSRPRCPECHRAANRAAMAARRAAHPEASREQARAWSATRYATLKAAGICVISGCGQPAVPGNIKCQACAGLHNTKSKARQAAERAKVLELLGGRCRCCGAADRLEVDHVVPVGLRDPVRRLPFYLLQDVAATPDAFQLLCWECNRWKDNGPACPCKWWDTVDAGWRERAREAMKGKGTRKD